MSKLSFRARALDASRPMQVFRGDEVPDMSECTAINRSVPQMPTGMEKEEESEHHLQQAITAQTLTYGATSDSTVIPTPEVFECPPMEYDKLYPPRPKLPRPYIHVHLLSIEHDYPDYDADTEDEDWVNEQCKHLPELTVVTFERMMDLLEKASTTHAVSEKDAKSILRESADLIQVVYDYWLNKRLKYEHALTPTVRTEKKEGAVCSNNPYVAFRRRTEKMQTRKNRKNDEVSYEKMLKLKRDFIRSLDILNLVKDRESQKRELLQTDVEVFDKRFRLQDFNGQILHEVSAIRPVRPPSYYNNVPMRSDGRGGSRGRNEENVAPGRKRKERKKQRDGGRTRPDGVGDMLTSDDEPSATGAEEEEDPDGIYAFKRKKGCQYLAPAENPESLFNDLELGERRQRAFFPASLSRPSCRAIGLARRRVGRGGRIVLDRMSTAYDDLWSRLDEADSAASPLEEHSYALDPEVMNHMRNSWPHYRPQAFNYSVDTHMPSDSDDELLLDSQGDPVPVIPVELTNDFTFDRTLDEEFYYFSAAFSPKPLHDASMRSSSVPTSHEACDFASFKRHEEELARMQSVQMEKLKTGHGPGIYESSVGCSTSLPPTSTTCRDILSASATTSTGPSATIIGRLGMTSSGDDGGKSLYAVNSPTLTSRINHMPDASNSSRISSTASLSCMTVGQKSATLTNESGQRIHLPKMSVKSAENSSSAFGHRNQINNFHSQTLDQKKLSFALSAVKSSADMIYGQAAAMRNSCSTSSQMSAQNARGPVVTPHSNSNTNSPLRMLVMESPTPSPISDYNSTGNGTSGISATYVGGGATEDLPKPACHPHLSISHDHQKLTVESPPPSASSPPHLGPNESEPAATCKISLYQNGRMGSGNGSGGEEDSSTHLPTKVTVTKLEPFLLPKDGSNPPGGNNSSFSVTKSATLPHRS